MPHIGLLLHLIERRSLEDNWEAVLRLLDRVEPHVRPDDRDTVEFLLYHRGYALLELQRPGDAVESLRRLVKLDGAQAHQRLLLADALIRGECWEEALAQLEAGLAEEPEHPGCLCAMGWTLYQMGELEEGRTLLEQALEVQPLYHPAHLDLGLIHAAEGRWELSEAHLRSALVIAPEDTEVAAILAAVRESRARATAERRKVRQLSAELRIRRATLSTEEARLFRRMRRALRAWGAGHLAVLLAEQLWFDVAARASPHRSFDKPWAAAVSLAALRLNEVPVTRDKVARHWDVSPATLDRRHRTIRTVLTLTPSDPRYAVEALLDGVAVPADPSTYHPARVIPVDFTTRQRLPDRTPCPCGSGDPVAGCRHPEPSEP
jgi:tetratricopeptide (TPR) repeat protein